MKRENRTSDILRRSFRSQNSGIGGFTARNIQNNDLRKNMSEESKIRAELQKTIIKLVNERRTIEEIEEILNEEKYKKYEQYIGLWVQDRIFKENPEIKSVLTKALNRNEQEQEIIEEIKKANIVVYELYKEQIEGKVRDEIQIRENKKNREEKMKNQEEER